MILCGGNIPYTKRRFRSTNTGEVALKLNSVCVLCLFFGPLCVCLCVYNCLFVFVLMFVCFVFIYIFSRVGGYA
jgi:hypothetical protein